MKSYKHYLTTPCPGDILRVWTYATPNDREPNISSERIVLVLKIHELRESPWGPGNVIKMTVLEGNDMLPNAIQSPALFIRKLDEELYVEPPPQ